MDSGAERLGTDSGVVGRVLAPRRGDASGGPSEGAFA